MSIPTPFNPMGTLGRAKRPFPMVRLTSNTAGSTVDGGPLPTGFRVGDTDDAWKMLNGDSTETSRVPFTAGIYYELDFGAEIELVSLSCYARMNGSLESESQYWFVQALIDGEYVKCSANIPINSWNAEGWKTAQVFDGTKARVWRIQRGGGQNGRLHEIDYNAFYA